MMKRSLMRLFYALLIMLWAINPGAYLWAQETAETHPTTTETETAAEAPSDAESEALRKDVEEDVKKSGDKVSFDKLFAIWDKTTKVMSKGKAAVSKGTAKGAELLSLIPKSLMNELIQKELGMKNVSISNGPAGFRNSFSFNGTAQAGGKPVTVTLMYAPKLPEGKKGGGNSLTFSIPKGTPIDKIIPGANIKALGTVPISDLKCVLSDFDYTDPATNYPIVKGFNILVALDPSSLGILNLDKIKKVIHYEGGPILGVATITKTPTEQEAEAGKTKKKYQTKFKVIVPPGAIKVSSFKLSELTDLLNIPIPSKIKSELSKVVFDHINIGIDLTPNFQSFSIEGKVDIFGVKDVSASYRIFRAELHTKNKKEGGDAKSTVLVQDLTFNMPNDWSITKIFPSIKVPFTAQNQAFHFISQSHHSSALGDVEKGVLYEGSIDIGNLGNNPILKSMSKVLGGHMTLRGYLAEDPANTHFDITLSKDRPKDATVSLGDIIPSKFNAIKKELSQASFSLNQLHMEIGGKNTSQALDITGTTKLGKTEMPTTLHTMLVGTEWKGDFIISIPQKVSGISALDAMSDLPVSSLNLAIIQVPFTDPKTGAVYEEGVNIGGFLGFSGKLSFVKKVFPGVKGLDGLNINAVIGAGKNIKFEASIPGVSELKMGNVTMTQLKIYMTLGTQPAYGFEGKILVPVPKQFRPKKPVAIQSTSIDTTFEMDELIDLDNIATQADAGSAEPTQAAPAAAPVAAAPAVNPAAADVAEVNAETSDASGNVVLADDTPNTPPTEPLEGEVSNTDDTPLADLNDTEPDMSGFGAEAGENAQLTFTGSLAVSGDSGILNCTMDGVVDLMGLILGNVGFEAQVLIAAPPVPSGIGFRADMQIGEGKSPKVINFAAKVAVGATTTSYAWFGSFKGGLYLRDIVDMSYKMVKHAPKSTQKVKEEFFAAIKKIPKIGIDELSMAIIPTPTTIAGKSYEEGSSADIKFVLFGAHGEAAIQMNYTGMSGKGTLDRVALPRKSPQFILSSFDGKTGPSVSFSVGKQGVAKLGNEFMIDGNIEIKPLGMKSATKIEVTASGGKFETAEKMYGLYEIDLEGEIPLRRLEKSRLKGSFKQDALTKLSKALKEASDDFIKDSKKELDKAREDVTKDFDAKIEVQRNIVKHEREKATGTLSTGEKKAETDINKEIEKSRKKIADLKKRIANEKNKCKHAKGIKKADRCAKAGANITKHGFELSAEETYLNGLLKPGKKVAKGTIEAAKGTVNLTPIDSDPRVSSLIATKKAALAGIKIGNVGADSLGKMGKMLADLGDKAVNLKSVSLDVFVGDLINAKLPKFSIEGVFFGKKVRVKNFQLDLKNPAAIKKLAGDIMHSMKL